MSKKRMMRIFRATLTGTATPASNGAFGNAKLSLEFYLRELKDSAYVSAGFAPRVPS